MSWALWSCVAAIRNLVCQDPCTGCLSPVPFFISTWSWPSSTTDYPVLWNWSGLLGSAPDSWRCWMCASGFLFPAGKTIDRGEPSLCGSVLAWGRVTWSKWNCSSYFLMQLFWVSLLAVAYFLFFCFFFMWCKGMIHPHPWSLGFSQRHSYLWIVATLSVKGNNAKDFLFCHLLILLQKDFGRNWQLE